jgi:hypothetical protein
LKRCEKLVAAGTELLELEAQECIIASINCPFRVPLSQGRALKAYSYLTSGRTEIEKALLCELPSGVVHNAERRSIPRNWRAGTHVLKPRMWGTVAYGPPDERARLENSIRFCRGQNRPCLVKSVSPGQVELLQVIVSIIELAPFKESMTPQRESLLFWMPTEP